ncbi:hypothetical protein [Phenylobacterium sp.]|uniref:hypothetical protein n=1 Tax=Phenylobacterium sp. TaxID=1871053 RepID=UPI002FC5F595
MPPVTWPQAILGGVAAGALAWWIAGLSAVDARALTALTRAPTSGRVVDGEATLSARLRPISSFDIFPAVASTEAGDPAPVAATALRLHGTSISARRRAALVSADGGPARWLTVGQPDQGLVLVSLAPGQAVVRTSTGDQVTLALFPPEAGPSDPDGASHAAN